MQATEWEQVEGKNTKRVYQAWKPQDTVRFKPSYNTIVPSTSISSTPLHLFQLISSGCWPKTHMEFLQRCLKQRLVWHHSNLGRLLQVHWKEVSVFSRLWWFLFTETWCVYLWDQTGKNLTIFLSGFLQFWEQSKVGRAWADGICELWFGLQQLTWEIGNGVMNEGRVLACWGGSIYMGESRAFLLGGF